MAITYTKAKKLEILTTRLDLYIAAETAILEGAQDYKIGSRSLTRADLAEVRATIETLLVQISELEAVINGKKARKAFGVVPRDF